MCQQLVVETPLPKSHPLSFSRCAPSRVCWLTMHAQTAPFACIHVTHTLRLLHLPGLCM